MQQIDLHPGETVQDWHIPGQPRWLSLSPDGRSLFVASSGEARLHRIDLDTDAVEELVIPELTGILIQAVEKYSLGGYRRTLLTRITGKPAISDDGLLLAVPLLRVDTEAPTNTPDADQLG